MPSSPSTTFKKRSSQQQQQLQNQDVTKQQQQQQAMRSGSSKSKEKKPARSPTPSLPPTPMTPSSPRRLSSSVSKLHQYGSLGGGGIHRSNTSSQSTLSSATPPPSTPNRMYSSMSLMTIGSELLLDHSHLKPGANAALLSHTRTINMYRENAKKTNNMEIQHDFAMFLVEAAKRLEQKEEEDAALSSMSAGDDDDNDNDDDDDGDDMGNDGSASMSEAATVSPEANTRRAYLLEAEKLLKQLALRSHSESQYYLANMYAAGLLSKHGEPDFDKAFPLFVQAAKHHNPDAAFRTAKCYEDGLGTRRDKAKSVQFYRKAAALNHPGAMYRLGLAEMNCELGIARNLRDGHKWLKRSAEAATPQYPHALHELALLHEKGFDTVIFADHTYAVHLYSEAAALGYAPSAFRLGECYEFGRLGCKIDAALSIHYYSIAAEQDHPEACFALTAWYLMGVDGVLDASEDQAFAWAYRATSTGNGLPKAEFAIGYFYECGIGVPKDIQMAIQWYNRAAAKGDKRAAARLHQAPPSYRSSAPRPMPAPSPSQRRLTPSFSTRFFEKAKGLTAKKEKNEPQPPLANFL
ncbi:hypothetical protein O0I10_010731 [Lichtheimia ornata]|uniref:Hcp-like protein n=1 Tax=Lichtheimia ornata TaxID=688661 RepID=A0AAD7XR15_9FUNG|nr:uncharacterized protein O0I10_010731 [Lichtheimia ornata]KAJ8653584.1 hypothetical protein O0I10_010731 [Lichtheimia ornata]